MEADAEIPQPADLHGTVHANSESEHALNEQILADQRDKMQWHPVRRIKAVGQEILAIVQDITRT
jgi:hypothetical protein